MSDKVNEDFNNFLAQMGKDLAEIANKQVSNEIVEIGPINITTNGQVIDQLRIELAKCQTKPVQTDRLLKGQKAVVYAIVEKDWNDDPNVYDTVVDIYWDKTVAESEAESRTLARKGKRYPDAAYYVQEFEVK